MNTKTVVFIHGLFVNNTSWNQWKAYFEAKGFTVYAPANPGHEGQPSQLRASTHPQLTTTGFEDVVMNVSNFIDTLPEKPIVVGHSLAGLVVQKLIEIDKAVAGISIDGAPPKNAIAPFDTVKIVLPVVIHSRVILLSWEAKSGITALSSTTIVEQKAIVFLKRLRYRKAARLQEIPF